LKVLITDHDFPDLDLELALFRDAGVEVLTGQCRTEEEVIAASGGCEGLLVQYAPVNARVLDARPEIRIASRFGAGFDTINVDDARKRGVWVANSPDYGVARSRPTRSRWRSRSSATCPPSTATCAGRWHTTSTGRHARSQLTLGILGLGRIGKRMARSRARCFGSDPRVRSLHRRRRVSRISSRAWTSSRFSRNRTCSPARAPQRRDRDIVNGAPSRS
jgi:D-3-phosphoglycerate dehydrogenase